MSVTNAPYALIGTTVLAASVLILSRHRTLSKFFQVIRAHVLHNPAHAFRPIYDPEEPTQAAQPSVPSPGLEVER